MRRSIVSALLAFACSSSGPPAEGPSFVINSPEAGSSIAGAAWFSLQPADPSAVARAEFLAGEVAFARDDDPRDGLRVFLISRDHAEGDLTLEARVTGVDGSVATQRLVVRNIPNPPSSITVGEAGAVLGTTEQDGALSTLTIQPGDAAGSDVTFIARTKDEVKADTGVDYDALGVTFLGAQTITTTQPFDRALGVSSGGFGPRVQPGQAVVQYRIAPDADGDGRGELIVVNTATVAPNGDVISDPVAKGLLLEAPHVPSAKPSHSPSQGPPGTFLQLHVAGFNPRSAAGNVAEWTCADGSQITVPGSVFRDLTSANPSAQIFQVLVPGCPPGLASVLLRNRSTGATVGPLSVTVTAAPVLANPVTPVVTLLQQQQQALTGLAPTGVPAIDAAVEEARERFAEAEAEVDDVSPSEGSFADQPDGEAGAPAPGGLPCLDDDTRDFLRKRRDKYIGLALASFPADPNSTDFTRAEMWSDLAAEIRRILELYPTCDEDEEPPPCTPTANAGSGTVGMGSAPPPGGPGCGNVVPPPPTPSAKELLPDLTGRVVVRIFVDGQTVPFSGATDGGGYFFVPFLPEGREFTAIAFDTVTGQGRSFRGVGPATGQSIGMAFDFSRAEEGNVTGTVRSGGEPVGGVWVRALFDGANALSVIGQARTDASGAFSLPRLPAGSYTLETRALNHGRTTQAIEVDAQTPISADLEVVALSPIEPATVYVIGSGNESGDAAVLDTLRAGGHTPTLGAPIHLFDGSASLSGYDAVILLHNYDWTSNMPPAGQEAIAAYAMAGGGVVTAEWLVWNISRGFDAALGPIVPVTAGPFNGAAATTYSRVTAHPVVDRDLPASFDFLLGNLSGSESFFTPKTDAITFYQSSNANAPGLVGWNVGSGRVISFSTLVTETELRTFGYQQLLINATSWVARRGE
jgi:Carboxypeptidase regulatory-like domain